METKTSITSWFMIHLFEFSIILFMLLKTKWIIMFFLLSSIPRIVVQANKNTLQNCHQNLPWSLVLKLQHQLQDMPMTISIIQERGTVIWIQITATQHRWYINISNIINISNSNNSSNLFSLPLFIRCVWFVTS